MLDPTHPISAFFDDEPERIIAALDALEQSSGQVKSLDTLYRKVGERELRGERDGLFDARIFGPEPDRFGHIYTLGVVHPCAYPHLVSVLGFDTPDIIAIAHARKLLRGDTLVDDLLDSEDDDLTGPRGLAEAVRRRQPDHPLLPLLTITHIPVPPLAARPLHPSSEPEAVDAWIGPVNEAWRTLVEHAERDARMRDLNAPPIITMNEAGSLQRALDVVYRRTRQEEGWLVPPMVRASEETVVAIAYAGPERIVVQRGTGVAVLDISGRPIHSARPSGCILRGVVDNRYAVFHDFQRDLYPFNDEEGYWPDDIARHMSRVQSPISVLDVQTGAFLERAPANLPRTLVENGEPEELFLGGRSLDEVGGDRPAAAAYTNDLRFALISGDSSQIISLATGRTVARPATTYPDEITESLDLTTGKVVEHDWDDQGGGGESAIAFTEGKWFTFDHYGVLCDHLGTEAIVIVPHASAAAFDPSGAKLALVVEDELVIVDRKTRAIDARFRV